MVISHIVGSLSIPPLFFFFLSLSLPQKQSFGRYLSLMSSVIACVFILFEWSLMITISLWKILWTFSIYLEAVAILPQLVLLQRSRNVDNLTGNYVFLLGYAVLCWDAYFLLIMLLHFLIFLLHVQTISFWTLHNVCWYEIFGSESCTSMNCVLPSCWWLRW